MEGAFAWIGSIAEWVGQFVPALVHVQSNYAGVKFVRSKTKVLQPGIHVYWPVTSSVLQYPTARQTLNLPAQFLLTADERVIMASVTVVFTIDDIEKAIVDTWDFNDTIRDVAQGAAKLAVCKRQFAELVKDTAKVDNELAKKIRSAVKPYGVAVENAFLTDFAPARVHRIVGDPPEQIRSRYLDLSE